MILRVLAASLAGAVVFFGLGFVIYGVLLDAYFKANMVAYPGLMKEPMPDMVMLFAWNFMMAFLFAFVFDKWAGIRTFVGGLKGGAILQLIVALIIQLQYLAFMNIMKGYLPSVVDVLAATVLGAIAGGVVGLVLGLMNKGAAAD